MVDVSDKGTTARSAVAKGYIKLNKLAYDMISNPKNVPSETFRSVSKGPVLLTAQLAGIQAAKRTASLIPLCHPLPLSHVDVKLEAGINRHGTPVVYGSAKVLCEGKTGVEMEALTAVSVSLLTVWDMVKAVAGQDMMIEGLHVMSKHGGDSGDFIRTLGYEKKPTTSNKPSTEADADAEGDSDAEWQPTGIEDILSIGRTGITSLNDELRKRAADKAASEPPQSS